MPRSNSRAFAVVLSWRSRHAGVTPNLNPNRHPKIRMKRYFTGSTVPPNRRDLKFRGSGDGAAKFCGAVTLPLVRFCHVASG